MPPKPTKSKNIVTTQKLTGIQLMAEAAKLARNILNAREVDCSVDKMCVHKIKF